MQEPITLSSGDMFSLFKLLYKKKPAQYHISTPYLKDPLFHLNFHANRAQLALNYSHGDYDREISRLKSSSVYREIPEYFDVREALIQSGVLTYANLPELMAKLHRLSERDYFAGDRPIYLALDTNLLRDRFYTTQQNWLKMLPRNKIGFCLSPYIKFELNFTRAKYREKHLEKLKKALANGRFEKYIGKFINQNCLEERQRRLGFMEFKKIHRLQWLIELPTLDEDELQESGDNNILLSYQQAVEERNLDIFLLSRDNDFIAQGEGIAGIHPFLLETPQLNSPQLEVASWFSLAQLLYCLAILYGVIELSGNGSNIVLAGIWGGKQMSDWKAERLRADLPEEDPIFHHLLINLEILKEMAWEYCELAQLP